MCYILRSIPLLLLGFGLSTSYILPMLRHIFRSPHRVRERCSFYSPISLHSENNFVEGNALLQKLRIEMKNLDIDGVIVPSDDPHLSEYVAPCYERRAFISGFTGSAGTALVTQNEALLWTDGRYFLQAEQELHSGWTLMRSGETNVLSLNDYVITLLAKYKDRKQLAVDSATFSNNDLDNLKSTFESANISLVSPMNLVDIVWGEERPLAPCNPVRKHSIEFAGVSVSDKLKAISSQLEECHDSAALLVSALDEIAWVLNLRGQDIPFNPVFEAYLIIFNKQHDEAQTSLSLTSSSSSSSSSSLLSPPSAILFINSMKMNTEVELYLSQHNVTVMPYEEIHNFLTSSEHNPLFGKGSISYDKFGVNYRLTENIPMSKRKALSESLIGQMKAVKNKAEISGMKSAHKKDGAALVELLTWLFEVVKEGGVTDEVEIDEVLTSFRESKQGFLYPSFPTIAGVDKNGAIIHYRADRKNKCGIVTNSSMLLLDSGGQYEEGTTDVTRTVHLGTPSRFQQECFTRVLKGHIALDTTVFPENTPGFVLDVLARRSLWEVGLDYKHGTGHGVGAALNVHEGPIGISTRYSNANALKAGMICSNEPGYYLNDQFGIRIENLLLIESTSPVPLCSSSSFNSQTNPSFLKFNSLTLVPIQKTLLMFSLLTSSEIDWLNRYHHTVRKALTPLLNHNSKALDWLRDATEPINHASGYER